MVNLDACAYFIHAGHQPDKHRLVYLRVATEFKQSLLAIVYTTYEMYIPAEVQYSSSTALYIPGILGVMYHVYIPKKTTDRSRHDVGMANIGG